MSSDTTRNYVRFEADQSDSNTLSVTIEVPKPAKTKSGKRKWGTDGTEPRTLEIPLWIAFYLDDTDDSKEILETDKKFISCWPPRTVCVCVL